MLLITSGVSTLLMTLGHAPLQGHEPMAERVVTLRNIFLRSLVQSEDVSIKDVKGTVCII